MDIYYLGLRFFILYYIILHNCTITHSYRLHPISALLSMQESVFWLVVQCGVPMYVRLGGKGCSLSMALEIPVASKLGTPRVFWPQASCNWEPQFVADHINGPIEKLCRRTMEPCTTTKQPPSLDIVDKSTISAWNKRLIVCGSLLND